MKGAAARGLGALDQILGRWQLAQSSSIHSSNNQPMMHPVIIRHKPGWFKGIQNLSSVSSNRFLDHIRLVIIESLSLALNDFWVSLGEFVGVPSYAGWPPLGVRIHQPAKTNDSSWWNIIIARSYTALPHRWNIIIVRVKNEPGATGALMELLPHGLDLSFWGQTHLKMNPVNLRHHVQIFCALTL